MALRDKTREEQFKIWKKRIALAKELHREKVLNRANKHLKEFSGENSYNLDTGERYTQAANIIQAIEQTIVPHLFFQNPRMTATAQQPQWEKREPLVAAVVNHEYKDIKMTGHRIELENDLVIVDARLLPFGCTKTTYEVEGDILKEPIEQSMTDKLGGFLTGKEAPFREIPVIEREIGTIVERRNPLKVYLDYSALHITKQKFIIEEMAVSKDDLRKTRYEQDKLKDIEPNSTLLPEMKFGTSGQLEKYLNDPDFKGFQIYEIHDLENRVIHTICSGVDDFIEFGTPYPIAEGSQYAFLWFIDSPNSVYPVPPIEFYRKRAQEYSYVYSEISRQIDKFMPKIFVNMTKLDKPDQEKLKKGGLASLIGVTGSTNDAASVFSPQIQGDLLKYLALTKELLFMESGAADYEVSVDNTGDKSTATEIEAIQRSVKARRFAPQKKVKGFLINQARTIFLTLRQNATEEHYIKVLGKDQAEEWWNDPETGKESWNKDDITGDYTFDFNVESIAYQNEAMRKQQNALNMETILRPELREALKVEKKELIISNSFSKFAEENLGIKDKSQIMRDIEGMEPGDEHTLWMNGQYPPISEQEQKDFQFLMKHFQEHQKFMNSPAFATLPQEIQHGALSHIESYMPFIQQMQAQKQEKSLSLPNRRANLPIKKAPMEEMMAEAL